MITKKEFTKFIEAYQAFSEGIRRLSIAICGHSYGTLWESDWCDSVGKMLDVFLDSHFTDSGTDWIFYYLFEDVNDKAAYVKQNKDIFNEEKEIRYPLDTIDELWNFLMTDKKTYFKNAE